MECGSYTAIKLLKYTMKEHMFEQDVRMATR